MKTEFSEKCKVKNLKLMCHQSDLKYLGLKDINTLNFSFFNLR